jgi:hypothetical protein
MRDRRIPGVEPVALARGLQDAATRMWNRMGEVDHAGRSVDQLSPQSFPVWEGP